jgi:CHASE3 domain sensor protein
MNKRNNWNLDTTDLLNENIMSVKRLVEKTNKLIKKEKKTQNQNLINLTEWKEAARRIDIILLAVSILVVTLVPVYLFSGYVFRNIILSFSEKCSCSL